MCFSAKSAAAAKFLERFSSGGGGAHGFVKKATRS